MNEITDRDRQRGKRIAEARKRAGFESPADAAASLGIKPPSYYHYESGRRQPADDIMLQLARRFRVPVEWLHYGVKRETPEQPTLTVREIDLRAGAGGGGVLADSLVRTHNGITIADEAVADRWGIPNRFLEGELRVKPANAWIIEVAGDSGYDPNNPHAPGSLFPGDRVIIDTADQRPSPPGPFAIHDGIGVVVKMVEVVHGTDPMRLRLSSRNPAYQPYEVVEGEAHIIGRVRGRISAL